MADEEFEIASLEELKAWVKTWSPKLSNRSLILLRGEMGVGKTQFVRFLVEAAGGDSREVGSPTYSLQNIYSTQTHSIFHWDLYRLETLEDLESSGFWDAFESEAGWVAVEWPDLVLEALRPRDWFVITIEFKLQPNGHRKISIGRR